MPPWGAGQVQESVADVLDGEGMDDRVLTGHSAAEVGAVGRLGVVSPLGMVRPLPRTVMMGLEVAARPRVPRCGRHRNCLPRD